MTETGKLVFQLRNTTTREIERALQKDSFVLARKTATGGRVYQNNDRIVVIHYHRGSDTFTRKTLKSILEAARWTHNDAKRLGLV
jgi:predicted RNA binding protein YcfA (HicA-like mRNA interferase family)